jgi:hypothetical protein
VDVFGCFYGIRVLLFVSAPFFELG